jgi:hypothetical protein
MDTSYTYRPLRTATSIRLIELLPAAAEEEPLACRIRHADLADSEPPEFEAISYVWGSEADKPLILCDDAGTGVRITQNLAAALRQFRPVSGAPSRALWTDGICINQRDDTEKAQQIPLMEQIYSQASVVLIWLGTDSNSKAGLAWRLQKEVTEQVLSRIGELKDWEPEREATSEPVLAGDQLVRRFGLPPIADPAWVALRRLFQNAWFTRAWTFQESWLATRRNFIWGACEFGDRPEGLLLSYRVLFKISRLGDRYRHFADGLANAIGMLEGQRFWDKHLKLDFLSLLVMRRRAMCKYPHDKIYSLLGLVDDMLGIHVSYTLPWARLYGDLAVRQIRSSGNFAILGHAGPYAASPPDLSVLPSWVPDWRQRDGALRHLTLNATPRESYRSSGSSRPQLTFEFAADGRPELSIWGIQIDTVVETHPLAKEDIIFEQHIDIDEKGRYRPTGEDVETVLLRTKTADMTHMDSTVPEKVGLQQRWNETSLARLGILKSSNEQRAAYNAWARQVTSSNGNSHWIATQKGRLGQAPPDTVGAAVCVVLGSEVPLLLRLDAGDGRFAFVGECYLHGFMDGEALVLARRQVLGLAGGGDWDMYAPLDDEERAWLGRLHEEKLPFVVRELRLK